MNQNYVFCLWQSLIVFSADGAHCIGLCVSDLTCCTRKNWNCTLWEINNIAYWNKLHSAGVVMEEAFYVREEPTASSNKQLGIYFFTLYSADYHTYVMGLYAVFCAHVHTPLSGGTGSYCYLSSFLAPELLTSSPEGVALHQDYSLQREHVTCVVFPDEVMPPNLFRTMNYFRDFSDKHLYKRY